jgi:iron complex outermembrane receptor protein
MQTFTLSVGKWLCCLAFLSIALLGNAQTITVQGRVLDAANNEPLVGATIGVKGTTQGTVTDVDGTYSISTGNENAILLFSFVGYTNQEIAIQGRNVIDAMLQPDNLILSQVVVVGYGSTTERNLTGSVKSLKAEDLNRGIFNSPEQLLQGKVAGVNVVAANGEPGAAQRITVRGPGGVRTGSTPLFVLDGLALDNSGTGGSTNPLNFLNPQDIESIDVLKDASATAIYGARGANGVILITTKRGKSGQATLNYSGNLGVSNLARKIDLFGAEEYLKQVAAVGGTPQDFGADTDWQQEIARTGITQRHNLSIAGGTNKLTYYASFGLTEQEGILSTSELDIYSGRLNATQSFWDGRLKVEAGLNATQTNNLRPDLGGLLGTAISINPTYPAYLPDGRLNPIEGDFINPLRYYEIFEDISRVNRIIGNLSPSLEIIKGLTYKLNFGIDQSTGVRDFQSFASVLPVREGRLQTNINENTNRLIENYVTYNKKLGTTDFTVLAGHSYQRFFVAGRSYSINRFPVSEIEPINNPGLGQGLDLNNNRPTGFALINELQSFFGRVNVGLQDKYLFTATLRADGSSKFGDNNKYGIFPSFSAAWRISDEPFMQNTPFNDLKLRAGWGQTGNQEIPSKITQPLFTASVSATSSYPLGEGPYPVGTSFARLANPNIQWEVSQQTNIGLDFALFNGALSGTVDYFNKVSTNILLEVVPADPVQPATTFWTNVKDMEIKNEGVELELNYRHVANNGFGFELGGNITFINNEVSGSPYSVIFTGSVSGPGLTSAFVNGYLNGQPIGTFYLQEFIGFDEKGLNKFTDVDGDGLIGNNDRIAAGSALPRQIYSLTGGLSFKGLSLLGNFNGLAGNKIFDNTALANFYKLRLTKGNNGTPASVEFPEESPNNAAPISTRFLKNGDFFRLNNLTLSYRLNTQKLGFSKYVNDLNFFITGQNLFLITKYDGWDPEVDTDRQVDGILSYGIDNLSYPRARTFVFGVNVGF